MYTVSLISSEKANIFKQVELVKKYNLDVSKPKYTKDRLILIQAM